MADNNKDVLIELKKMNEFLEKIDWKLWTLHEKVFGANASEKSSPKETGTKDVEPVVPTAKYPTIETWE